MLRRYILPSLLAAAVGTGAAVTVQSLPEATPVVASYAPVGAEGPLTITVDEFYQGPLRIEDRTFAPTGKDQTGLTVIWPKADSIAEVGARIRNITCKPRNGFTFETCVRLVNGWNVTIEGLNAYGPPDQSMLNCLRLEGQSIDVRVDAVACTHAQTGISIVGESEGTVITRFTLLGVRHGIFALPSSGGTEPWLVASDGHISASRAAFLLKDRTQVMIHHVLIYRHPLGEVLGEPFDGLIVWPKSSDVSLDNVIIDCDPAEQKIPKRGPGRGVVNASGSPVKQTDVTVRRCA